MVVLLLLGTHSCIIWCIIHNILHIRSICFTNPFFICNHHVHASMTRVTGAHHICRGICLWSHRTHDASVQNLHNLATQCFPSHTWAWYSVTVYVAIVKYIFCDIYYQCMVQWCLLSVQQALLHSRWNQSMQEKACVLKRSLILWSSVVKEQTASPVAFIWPSLPCVLVLGMVPQLRRQETMSPPSRSKQTPNIRRP